MPAKFTPKVQADSRFGFELADRERLTKFVAANGQGRATRALGTTPEKVETLTAGGGITKRARDRILAKLNEVAPVEAPAAEGTVTVRAMSMSVTASTPEEASSLVATGIKIASAFIGGGE